MTEQQPPHYQSKAFTPILYADANSSLKWMMVFALLWNAIAFLVAGSLTLQLPRELDKGNYAALIVYVFPLVGVLLIGWVIRTWLHDRRFGKTALILDPYPGAIGGQVGGEILIPVTLPDDVIYQVNIQCLHSKVTRNSKGERSTSTSLEWQDDMPARVEVSDDSQVRLRFCFDVPADLPAPTPKGDQWYHWQLSVSADVPGVDLDVSYELPMQPSTRTSAVRIPGLERERQRTRLERLQTLLGVDFQNDTLYFDFPYGRDKASALILLLAGAMFSGAGVGVLIAESGKDGLQFFITVFMSIFILVGCLMLLGAAYIPCNKLQVAIAQDAVHIRRFWLGLSVLNRRLPVEELKSLAIERRSSVNNGKRFTVYYRVVVVDQRGKRWPVAETIPGRTLAEETQRFLASHSVLRELRP